ncbi:hypothetical protein RI367_001833 [Sorochytrium milnesiophthora]
MSTSFFTAASQQSRHAPPLSALLQLSPLTPQVHAHLANVYTTLAAMAATSSAAVLAQQKWGILASSPGLTAFGTAAALIAFSMAPKTKQYESTRRALLFAFAAFKGLLLVPLVSFADFISPSIVPQAMTSTALIFLSFSLAAIFAKQRSMLYLGGMLASAVSMLFWASVANMFFASRMLFDLNVYLGLLVFAGYVVYDTQVIIYKAQSGINDSMTDALELYSDLVSVFVRILSILSKREAEKKRHNGEGNSSSGRSRQTRERASASYQSR